MVSAREPLRLPIVSACQSNALPALFTPAGWAGPGRGEGECEAGSACWVCSIGFLLPVTRKLLQF